MTPDRNSPLDPQKLIRLIAGKSPRLTIALVIVVAVGGLMMTGCPGKVARGPGSGPGSTSGRPTAEAGTYLFVSWNGENFFDDVPDPKNDDKEATYYAEHPEMFQKKAGQLAEALLKMADGYGPDIMALVEVESERCLTVLRDKLNERLEAAGRGSWKYTEVAFRDDNTGRRFAPGFISRVPIVADRTKKFGPRAIQRTLEVHFDVAGHELIAIASHWTSRLKEGNDRNRYRYAEAIYGETRAILTSNPDADVLVCGDFNDEFRDASMQDGLQVTADAKICIEAQTPRLLSLMAKFDGTGDPKGSIYGAGHWSVFDHICVSRGLLDGRGWTADISTTRIFGERFLTREVKGRDGVRHEPVKFRDDRLKGEYGYSDHFPVMVKLRVEGGK